MGATDRLANHLKRCAHPCANFYKRIARQSQHHLNLKSHVSQKGIFPTPLAQKFPMLFLRFRVESLVQVETFYRTRAAKRGRHHKPSYSTCPLALSHFPCGQAQRSDSVTQRTLFLRHPKLRSPIICECATHSQHTLGSQKPSKWEISPAAHCHQGNDTR